MILSLSLSLNLFIHFRLEQDSQKTCTANCTVWKRSYVGQHKMSERDMTVAAKCKYLALKQKCVSVGSSKEWIIIENIFFFCVHAAIRISIEVYILHEAKNEYNPIFMTILCVSTPSKMF